MAFLADAGLPDGFSGNILYVLPIMFAGRLGLGSPYLWAAAATLLSIVSPMLAPKGLSLPWEIADRAVTTAILWVTAALVARLDRRRLEAERASHEAEEANKRKSRFLAAASHDLRQPAQSLTLFAAVMRKKAAGTELESVIEPLEQAIAALSGMLTGLLDLSRLDAGVVRPRRIEVDIGALTTRLGTAYALHAKDKGIKFRLRCRAYGIILTDPEFIERVLRNLLDNALKYTEHGFIALTCFRRDGHIVFRICDSGWGIPPQYQKAVFEEFFQVGNEERDQAKGLGIGLSVVQRSVDMLGGKVSVWSRPGRGTIFTVILPA